MGTKIMSDKLIRIYILTSFVMIVFLSIAIIILFLGQKNIEKSMVKDNGVGEVKAELKLIDEKVDGIWSDVLDVEKSVNN